MDEHYGALKGRLCLLTDGGGWKLGGETTGEPSFEYSIADD